MAGLLSMHTRSAARLSLGLSLVGLAASGYLGFLHMALLRGELYGGALCGALGSLFNCHAVSASRWGVFLGLPLAFWGILTYLATFTLALIALDHAEWADRALTTLTGLAVAMLAADVVLLAVMLTQIGYLCALCLATYAVNAGLVLVGRAGLRQPWSVILRQTPTAWRAFWPRRAQPIPQLFWAVVLTGAFGVGTVHATSTFFSEGAPGVLRGRMAMLVQSSPRFSIDTHDAPRRGSADAPIQIVEFTDFFCPLCQDASRLNEILLADNRRDLSLVIKHFPLDGACNGKIARSLHPGACQLASAAACAQEQGRFWELYHRVFQQGPQYHLDELEQDVVRAGLDLEAFRGCMAGGRGQAVVQRDVDIAARLGITGTPTYLVNGILIRGVITPTVLQALREVLPPPPTDHPQS